MQFLFGPATNTPLRPTRSPGNNDCCRKQIMIWEWRIREPVNPTEDAFWRALMRIALSLPRQLRTDMMRATGLTASEYTLIMSLSKAPNRQLRIADLANAALLSASRTTRLVEGLESRALVVNR
jgi:hypothetical protein